MALTLKALRGAGLASSSLEFLLSSDPRLDEAAARKPALARALEAERARLDGMLAHERLLWQDGCSWVAGVDEVGRGPLAGPLVAAAVVFDSDPSILLLDDSKKRSPEERECLAHVIRARAAAWSLGEVGVAELNTLNLHHASLLALARALEGLDLRPDHVLVDGCHRIPNLVYPQTTLVKGDSRSVSIAAASILAKVHRDAQLDQLDLEFPGYGFAQHKGYGTSEHLQALRNLGVTPHHRLGFAPVAQLVNSELSLFPRVP